MSSGRAVAVGIGIEVGIVAAIGRYRYRCASADHYCESRYRLRPEWRLDNRFSWINLDLDLDLDLDVDLDLHKQETG